MQSGQWPPHKEWELTAHDPVSLPSCWVGPMALKKCWETCISLATLMGSFPFFHVFSEDIGLEEFVLLQMVRAVCAAEVFHGRANPSKILF